jgi:antitoxin component of MazEF toxin-antitoxin module
MTQKLIKIGSSIGVTIPKSQLQELGVGAGDMVKVRIEPVNKPKHEKLMHEYERFVSKYGKTLKNLSDR